MDPIDGELREIKREIVESRGLVIRTNNLVNALAADLKGIARRQQGYERRALVSSATAYVLFVVIAFVALKLVYDARVEGLRDEGKATRDKVARLDADLKAFEKRAQDRARAEAQGAAFYDLVRAERHAELVEQFEALRKEPLSRVETAFFEDAVQHARGQLSLRHYHLGLDHVRMGRWVEAAQAFEDSVRYQGDAAHAPAARLQLSRAYRKLNRQRDAVPLLVQLSEASADKEVMDDATMLLAECLIDIEAWNDAKTTLRSFLRRFPDSPFLNDARMALADLSIKH